MFKRIEFMERDYSPAAVGAGETRPLFQARAGWRIVTVSIKAMIAAAGGADSTVNFGDATTPAGFVSAMALTTAAGTLVPGAGTYTNQAGGKLYTVDTPLNAVYAGTTFGAVLPKIKVRIGLLKEWP